MSTILDPERFERLRITTDDAVAIIEMSSAPHNILARELREELRVCFEELRGRTEVRSIVLSGGEGGFCAGGDLREDRAALSGEGDPRELLCGVLDLLCLIERSPAPTIAAIDGPAYGAGLELACACDLRVASPRATFCASAVNIGLIAGQYRLPRIMGLGRAKEMLLTGSVHDASWATTAGLVNQVAEDPVGAARRLAAQIAGGSPRALRETKRLTNESYAKDLETLADEHVETVLELAATQDHAEAVRAFLEKDTPAFRDR